jgi:transcriptional regulator with XRE-family HTH domain
MGQPAAAEDLAAYLRELKGRTGRSYDALARRLGISSSALHRYCSGDGTPPRFAVLEQFAVECGATRAEVVELHRRWAVVASGAASPDADGVAPDVAAPSAPSAETSPLPAEAPAGPTPPDGVTAPARPRDRFRRWQRWALVPVGLLLAASVLFAADAWRDSGATADSSGPEACVERNAVRHVDDQLGDRAWTTDYLCPNRVEAALYLTPDSTRKIAVMDTAKSWFVCWSPGRVQVDGGTVWYYTRGDRSEPGASHWAGWGYVAAADVRATQHPWPQMPQCGFNPTLLSSRESAPAASPSASPSASPAATTG